MEEAYLVVGTAYVPGLKQTRGAWEMAFEGGETAFISVGIIVSRAAGSSHLFSSRKGWPSVLQRLCQRIASMGMFIVHC